MKWQYMFFTILILVAILVTNCTTHDTHNRVNIKLPASSIKKFSKEITVLIDSAAPCSGVIVGVKDGVYWVLTAKHAISKSSSYEIVTPNGFRYPISKDDIKEIPGADLALIPFASNKVYPLAPLDNSNSLKSDEIIYIAGIHKSPSNNYAINEFRNLFSPGESVSVSNNWISRDGYTLEYNNRTLPGMVGGPILNQSGQLVGVHGRENSGISISTAMAMISEVGINPATEVEVTDSSQVLTHISQAWEKNIETSKSFGYQSFGYLFMDDLEYLYLIHLYDAGSVLSPHEKHDPFVIGFDSNGSQNSNTLFLKSNICQDDGNYDFKTVMDSHANVYILYGVAKCLAKYSNNASLVWERPLSNANDLEYRSMEVDNNGNLYILSERDENNFLTKLDDTGSLIWERQWESLEVGLKERIAIDSFGNIYVAEMSIKPDKGVTSGMEDYGFIFFEEETIKEFPIRLTKLDSNGSILWQRQWTTTLNASPLDLLDNEVSISPDASGNIYVAGNTEEVLTGLHLGEIDNWLMKFDPNGAILWHKQWGTLHSEFIKDIEINDFSEVYILGITEHPEKQSPKSHVWIMKCDVNGNPLWSQQCCKDIFFDIKRYQRENYVNYLDLKIDNHKNFYVTGTELDGRAYLEYLRGQWIVKYSEN